MASFDCSGSGHYFSSFLDFSIALRRERGDRVNFKASDWSLASGENVHFIGLYGQRSWPVVGERGIKKGSHEYFPSFLGVPSKLKLRSECKFWLTF